MDDAVERAFRADAAVLSRVRLRMNFGTHLLAVIAVVFLAATSATPVRLVAVALFVAALAALAETRLRRAEREFWWAAIAEGHGGIVPICARCKAIRDRNARWRSLEDYFSEATSSDLSHTYCPPCESALLREGERLMRRDET